MDTHVSGYELTCGWCATSFFVCRRDYRGQAYCGEVCGKHASAASHRLAAAKYQRSLGQEGRQDRREQRVARKRAKSVAVPDVASRKVALLADCSPAPSTAGHRDDARPDTGD